MPMPGLAQGDRTDHLTAEFRPLYRDLPQDREAGAHRSSKLSRPWRAHFSLRLLLCLSSKRSTQPASFRAMNRPAGRGCGFSPQPRTLPNRLQHRVLREPLPCSPREQHAPDTQFFHEPRKAGVRLRQWAGGRANPVRPRASRPSRRERATLHRRGPLVANRMAKAWRSCRCPILTNEKSTT